MLGLEVHVDHVGLGAGSDDLDLARKDREGGVELEGLLLLVDEQPEALALDELEHEVRWLLVGVVTEERGDVGVVDSSGDLRLLDQARPSVVAQDELEGHDFAGSLLLASALGAPDLAEAAAPEGLEELVALAYDLARDVGRGEGEGLLVEALDVARPDAPSRDGALELLAQGVADQESRVVGAERPLGDVGVSKSRDDDVPARRELGAARAEPDAWLGQGPGQELVEQDPEREQVRARVEVATFALLGGHVGQGPGHGRGAAHEGHGEVDLLHEARRGVSEAEVEDLDAALGLDDDVLGLEVEVEDSSLVDRLEPGEELIAEQDHVAGRELAAAERPERLAGHELGHEVGRVVIEVSADEASDVGVIDLGQEETLLAEVSHEGGPEGELDRDRSARAVRAPDLPHAAAAESAPERIVAEGLSRLEARSWPRQGSRLVRLQRMPAPGCEPTASLIDAGGFGQISPALGRDLLGQPGANGALDSEGAREDTGQGRGAVALAEAGLEVGGRLIADGVNGEHQRELAAAPQDFVRERCEGEAEAQDLSVLGSVADGEQGSPLGLFDEGGGSGSALGQDLSAGRSRGEHGLFRRLAGLRRVEESEQSIAVAEQVSRCGSRRNLEGERGGLQGGLRIYCGP